MDEATFEQERRAMFEQHGFDGDGRWVTDRHGRRTYVLSRGSGERPTVLVHGGLSQAGEWSLMAGALTGHVVIPDRPGCGLSEPIDYRRIDFRRAAAEWLEDLADALGADRLDLVGSSIGGFFSIVFALAQPERVGRLVLVGAPPGLGGRKGPLFIRLWGTPFIGHLISRMKVTDPEKNRNRVFSNLVAHPEALPLDILENDIAAMALPGIGHGAYTMLRAMVTLRGVRPHLLLNDELAGLAVPTLFLWGDADTFVPMALGQAVAATMPDARFEVVAGAGHLVQLDRPEFVAMAIGEFLAQDVPGKASER